MSGGGNGQFYWGSVLGGILTILFMFVLNWKLWPSFKELDPPHVNAWGISLSIWGLLISFLGFGFTLWQLIRTERATRAAIKAIRRIKHDYASFEVIGDVRDARAAGKEALNHVNAQRWSDALVSYHAVHHSLNRVVEIRGDLGDENVEKAKDFIGYALDGYSSIQELHQRNPELINASTLIYNLLNLDGFLTRIEIASKDAIGGKSSTS